jgi:NAD(P)-dependent dehydrogenase (short-subunit alcohol dehydrogenase family)
MTNACAAVNTGAPAARLARNLAIHKTAMTPYLSRIQPEGASMTKTWFITGISRGLGKALAQAAIENGDTVIGTMRSGTPEIAAGPGALHVLPLEVTDPAAIEAAITAGFAITGRIDVLVNNAGYGLLGPFEHATDAQMAHLFEVDVYGPIRLIRAALPRLRAQGGGHIVNITSIAGRAPRTGSPLYSAAKYALEGLSHSLADELAEFSIKVTAVAPGAFRTDFLDPHSIRKSTGAGATGRVAEALAALDAMAGKQAGDPGRAAAAILKLVDSPNPPVHLLLGTDALTRFQASQKIMEAEMNEWESVTRGTDFTT